MSTEVDDILTGYGIPVSESNPNVDAYLEHVGVRGMHWGIRKRSTTSSGSPKSSQSSSTHSKFLSDDELKTRIARLQMEKQYHELTKPQMSKGKKMAQEILLGLVKENLKVVATMAVAAGVSKATGSKVSAKDVAKVADKVANVVPAKDPARHDMISKEVTAVVKKSFPVYQAKKRPGF